LWGCPPLSDGGSRCSSGVLPSREMFATEVGAIVLDENVSNGPRAAVIR
jgi:hypothetical protein